MCECYLIQLAQEKDDSEREKWEIVKRARDAAERALSLRTECDQKDKEIRDLRADLNKVNIAGLVGFIFSQPISTK